MPVLVDITTMAHTFVPDHRPQFWGLQGFIWICLTVITHKGIPFSLSVLPAMG